MSLVVAAATQDSLLAIADSKVSRGVERRNPYLQGTAKLAILDDRRFVAFAGAVDPALKELAKIDPSFTDVQLLSTLHCCTQHEDVEFICGLLTPRPHLFRIVNGASHEETRAFIGDFLGFREYQRYFLDVDLSLSNSTDAPTFKVLQVPEGSEGSASADSQLYARMFASMQAVINSGTVASVGGIVTPVFTSRATVRYGRYYCVFRKPLENSEISLEPMPISFGDATTGTFQISFSPIGNRSFVVHIPEGELGLIYGHASKSNISGLEPEIVESVDEIDFDELIEARYGEGPGTPFSSSLAHFGAKALKVLRNSRDFARVANLLTRGLVWSSRTWKGIPFNPAFKYDSLQACFDAEGPPLQIPTDEVERLRLAFFLRGGARFELGQLKLARSDLADSVTLGGDWPALHSLRARVEHALTATKGGLTDDQ